MIAGALMAAAVWVAAPVPAPPEQSRRAELLVFARDQTIDDIYPVTIEAAYDLTDVRRLPSTATDVALFGVLGAPDEVCLVGVFADLSTTDACVARRDFARDGVSVATHASWEQQEDGAVFVSRHLTWLPDGSIRPASIKAGADR